MWVLLQRQPDTTIVKQLSNVFATALSFRLSFEPLPTLETA
jgi:hypothetical protein